VRKTFHEELKSLREDVLTMGDLVVARVSDALTALLDENVELARTVIDGDDDVDRLYISIEESSISIMARQSPVARDLRLIHSVMLISVHLERMGDLAVNLAKTARRMAAKPGPNPLQESLEKMGKMTLDVVRVSLQAFADKDAELAERLPEMDEPIDEMHKEFLRELVNFRDEESLEWATSMILGSRYIERIADHAVDIGERVAYLVTGEFRDFNAAAQ
jgi:phosphate transport system protein